MNIQDGRIDSTMRYQKSLDCCVAHLNQFQDGDIVTIIGVGLHKSYLDIMGVEVPHSDAECVHRFAAELGL